MLCCVENLPVAPDGVGGGIDVGGVGGGDAGGTEVTGSTVPAPPPPPEQATNTVADAIRQDFKSCFGLCEVIFAVSEQEIQNRDGRVVKIIPNKKAGRCDASDANLSPAWIGVGGQPDGGTTR